MGLMKGKPPQPLRRRGLLRGAKKMKLKENKALMKKITFNNQLTNHHSIANRHSALEAPSLREGWGGLTND